jgi:hypothetical protein|tara:strand:- start:644 stop:886 length:243 start_codon:yes stop_codon:yes gene_type:complete
LAFQLIPFLIQLAIGFALQVIGYLLMGKPRAEKSDAATDLENPTAEAGRPIPVPFGEVEITGLNIIYYGEKGTHSYKVKS